jgi:hypothetical protein
VQAQHLAGTLPLNERLAQHDDYTGVIYRMKWRYRGGRHYELSNHLGNVQVVVTDKKIAYSFGGVDWAYYTVDVYTASDYGAFGQDIEERSFERAPEKGYRYGMNGQEKDDDVADGVFSAQYWEYDSRDGRRWNVDPVPQISMSDYSVNKNNPIYYTDPNGDCPTCPVAAAGAATGFVIGGLWEMGSQLYHDGKITSWKAVLGNATQMGVTGGAAGFTAGASLLTTTGTSVGASLLTAAAATGTVNAIGGVVNNAIQGKPITVVSVLTDVTIGAVFGAGGKLLGYGVSSLGNLNSSLVSKATEKLTDAAAKVLASMGNGSGHVFGTKAHSAFEAAIKGMKIGENTIRTEISYLGGRIVTRGTKGSVRIDAGLFDKKGNLLAVFDLKTGSAKLSAKDVVKIQTGTQTNVPVIEIRGK